MRKTLVVLALAAVAGCGGSGDSGGSGGGETRPADVASKLDCSGSLSSESTEELYVRELGKCTFEGAEVSLYTFKDNTSRDAWLKVASTFGGRYVVLDKAVVSSDSSAAIDAAASKTGGTVK